MRILIIRDHEIPILRDALHGAENDLRAAIALTRDLDPDKRTELVDALRVIRKTRDKIPEPGPIYPPGYPPIR